MCFPTGFPPEIHTLMIRLCLLLTAVKGDFMSRCIPGSQKHCLKRRPKSKPRRCHNTLITDRSVFTGRTYADFQSLNPGIPDEPLYKGRFTPCFRPSGKRLGTNSSLCLKACLQTEVMNPAIQIHLKQVLKESSVPAFIIVTLCCL